MLLIGGILMIANAVVRLAADWKKMKPRHSVGLVFLQILAGLAFIGWWWFLVNGRKA